VQVLHDQIRARDRNCCRRRRWKPPNERRSYITEAPDPDPLVRNLRRLSHDLVIIARALRVPLPETVAGSAGASGRRDRRRACNCPRTRSAQAFGERVRAHPI